MSGKMTVHGGMRFAGENPAIEKLELEELVADPTELGLGRLWLNVTEGKVKCVTHLNGGGEPVVTILADSDDLIAVNNFIDTKADKATTLEGYGIIDAIQEDDPRFNNPQVLLVRKVPGKGQFSSIAAAVASITDASVSKPYLIRVDAGVYKEPKIQMKSYIRVLGSGQENTYVEALDPNDDLVVGTVNAGIANVTLTGATGQEKALVLMDHPDGSTKTVFRVDEVRFGSAHTLVRVKGGYVTVNASTYGASYTFVEGFHASDDGIRAARIALRNTHSNGMSSPYPHCLMRANGNKSQVLYVGSMARASDSILTNSNVGTGLHLLNGGRFRGIGSSLVGFDKGIWAENAGAGPLVEAIGMNLTANNKDIQIDHPGTTGNFLGGATRTKVTVDPQVQNFALMYLDQSGEGVVNVGPMFVGKDHNTLANIEPIISRGMQTGLLEGGALARGTGLQVTVGAGSGYIKLNNALRNVAWTGATLTVPANEARYVYVDETNTVKTAVNLPDPSQNVIVGRYLAGPTSIIFVGTQGSLHIEEFNPNIDKLLRLALGVVYVSGSVVTAHPTIPRAINVTAGHYFYSATERKPAARTAPILEVAHLDNGVLQIEQWTAFDNTHYTGAGNVSVSAPAGYYLKHSLYTNGNGEDVGFIVAHATAAYATLQEARDAPNPTPLIKPDGSPMIASIIVQQGNNAFIEIIDTRPRLGAVIAGASASVSHGDLTGLDQDNHPQYLLSSGARKMTGDLDMDGNDLNNVGLVNGVDLDDHSGRHAPNGLDALPTAAAAGLSASSTNQEGIANSYARSDHTHQITGFQPVSTQLTRIAALTGAGIPRRNADGTWSLGGIAAADIPALDWSKITTGKPTTLAGYGITDAVPTNVVKMLRGNVGIMSGTSQITMGNTAPTINQGTLMFNRTITPMDAQSTFLLRFDGSVDANVSSNNNNSRTATVFVTVFRSINGAPATFIGCGAASIALYDNPNALSVQIEDAPNTTLPVTYSMRIGVSGSTSWYLGRTVSYSLGGTNPSGWSIAELRPVT